MNHKFLIALILSLKIEAHQPEKVVLLLDQIHESQAYWEVMARDKNLSFWKRSPHTWLASTWKADITCHQKNLAKQRAELIEVLANFSENQKSLSCESLSKIQTRTTRTLALHGAPSHFEKHWISYAGLCGGLAALALYLQHYQFQQVQIYGTDPLRNMYTILKNEDEPENKIFATDIKHNEQLYEDTITKVLVNAMTVDQTAPLMHRALNGKEVATLSFSEKQRIFLELTAELGDTINTECKHVGEFFYNENQKLQASKQNVAPFTSLEDDGRYPELYRKNIPKLNFIGTTVNELKKLAQNLGGEAQKYANLVNHLTEKNIDFAGLTTQILATHAFELKLKEASIAHMANNALHNAKRTLEAGKALVILYLGYIGARSIYQHTIGSASVVTHIKTDLISLQLVLNKERYTKDCAALSQDFKGKCFYWLQRLHRYKDNVPTSYRATYRRYLDDLENKTLLPEQKMTVITCLFHELDPFFRKG